ncbi:MAG: flippase-like domain-containing protein [Lachnospiraceae bacterium]|nr:flippase-like domain-containing protein [Lachnospiraceae bacterium]
MSKKTVKYILNIILIFLLAAGTLFFLLRGSEIKVVFSKIGEANIYLLLLGALFVVGYVCTESVIIRYILFNLKQEISLFKCILVSNVGFFFCGITPSATGGQPMQVFYLAKYGVDPLMGTLVIAVVTICYKMTLVLLTILFLIIRPSAMFQAIGNAPILFFVGVVIILSLIVFLGLCVYKTSIAFFIISKVITFGGKIKLIKNPDRTLSKAIHSIRGYEKASIFVKNHPGMIVGALSLTFIQRLLYFSVTFIVLSALHLDPNWLDVIAYQLVLALAVDALPLPGASGANETVFQLLYGALYADVAVSAVILNRGITYYFMMLFTLLFTIVAHFVSLRREKETKNTEAHAKKIHVLSHYVKNPVINTETDEGVSVRSTEKTEAE